MPPTLELLLADELNSRGSSFAELVLDLIEAEVPEMVEGAERRSMALAAADSLLADFATALRLGAGPERFHAPAGALAFATQARARGRSARVCAAHLPARPGAGLRACGGAR